MMFKLWNTGIIASYLWKMNEFLSHNIPKRNKLAENISQKNPEYMLNYSLPYSCSLNLSSFWFVIKQKLTTKEISILSNSSHFEWRAGLSDTILKGDSDGHVGWQPEVFNQNFERRPHMHSFHMVWLPLTLYRILKYCFNEFFTNFLFIVTMVAMFDGECGPQP